MNQTKSQFYATLLSGLATLVIGIVFTAKPNILSTVCLWAGIALCAAGAVGVLLYFIKKRTITAFLGYGVLALVLGMFLIIVPSLLKFLIPVLFGAWILLSSGSGLYRNFSLRREHRLWWVGFLLCAVGACLGLYVMTRPVQIIESTVRMIGIVMIVFAVLRVVSCFMARHYYANPPSGEVIDVTLNKD